MQTTERTPIDGQVEPGDTDGPRSSRALDWRRSLLHAIGWMLLAKLLALVLLRTLLSAGTGATGISPAMLAVRLGVSAAQQIPVSPHD